MRAAARVLTRVLGVALISSLPATAYAQATITGIVKDTSGAVLPGVTVEAASPALIEKDRKSTRLNSSHVSESRMPSSA